MAQKMGGEKVTRKDELGLNNKSHYEKNAERLISHLRQKTEEYFWEGIQPKDMQGSKPAHYYCDGFSALTKNEKSYEKRIVKCLYYYNTSKKRACENCQECKNDDFARKLRGDYRITEYEIPPIESGVGIGEIDMILTDGKTNYLCEVKPPQSTETIYRMVAEIVTYGKAKSLNVCVPDFDLPMQNAIAFFEGSEQDREYSDPNYEFYGKNTKLLIELLDIAVFRMIKEEDEDGKWLRFERLD